MPFAQLENRGVLTVSGSDRLAFLQGLVSNDVAPAMQGKPVWAALLTPQGKYKHDFFILGRGDTLLLECEGGDRLMDLGRSLRRFILRSDIVLGIEKDLATFVVWGDEAGDFYGDGNTASFADGLAFADPRLPEMGVRILAQADAAREALAESGIDETGIDAWHAHRIALGVPDGSLDLDIEKSILLEAGFDELHGIDWGKGCYMGQELTARTKYRGLLKRRLVPVSIEGGAVRTGDDISAGDRVVGSVKSVSASGESALATLRLDAMDGKAGSLMSGKSLISPRLPAWLSLPADR